MKINRIASSMSMVALVLGTLSAWPVAAFAAGQVKVVLKGKDLVITGDDQANDVQIFNIGGDVEVRGINGTTVDNSFPGIAANEVGRLTVKLKDGNDFFQINDGVFNKKVTISTGDGNDRIDLFSGVYKSKTTVSGGSGDDYITVTIAKFKEKLKIRCGDGEDEVKFGACSVVCDLPVFKGKLNVKMGAGADELVVEDAALVGVKANISGGDGIDNATPDPANLKSQGVKIKKFES